MTIPQIPTCKYTPYRNMWHANYTKIASYYHWRTSHPLLCVNIVCVYGMHKLAPLLYIKKNPYNKITKRKINYKDIILVTS